jgi:hypothetical protein
MVGLQSVQILMLPELVRRQDMEERRNILDWLSPLNFWNSQQDTYSQAEPGTGLWLFKSREFQSWIRGGNVRTLWCPGDRMSLLDSSF